MDEKLSLPGWILLLAGSCLGLFLSIVLLWTDIEALLYGFAQYGKQATNSMHCPYFLTTGETGHIRVRIKNTTDQTVHPTLKLQASATQFFRTKTVSLIVAPGESQTIEWEVGSQDVVWRRFIFVKMYTFASYPMRDVEQTCGILVVDFPWLRGQHIYLIALALFITLSASGAFLLLSQKALSSSLIHRRRSLIFLSGIAAADLTAASLGWWLPGILLTAIAVLMIGVLVGQLLQR